VRQDEVGEAEDATLCLDVLAFAGIQPVADFRGLSQFFPPRRLRRLI
jgi:hypothetical protein